MPNKSCIHYSLTTDDLIEADQLTLTSKEGRDQSFWIFILISIFYLISSILKLRDLGIEDLFSLAYIQKLLVGDGKTTGYLDSFLVDFSLFLLLFLSSVPKYSPLSRWQIRRRYGRNFVKQEPKTVTIDDTHIEIVSENHRKFMQWQDFSHFQENKQIFLLHGSLVKVIIPKRAFDNQELANMTSFFTSKIN